MTSRTNGWFHPLSAQAPAAVDRRRFMLLAGAGAAIAGASPRLRLVQAQTPASSPVAQTGASGQPEAVAVLDAAAAAMADLETFQFEIETVQGETTILEGLTLGVIEGGVRRPSDFTATVEVVVPFGSINVTAVGVEGGAWLQNPLADGAWISLEDAADVIALVNPDTLILAALGVIAGAEIDGTEKVNGIDTTRITGTIDLSGVAPDMGGEGITVASEPLDATFWIDEENLIHEIELAGPLLSTEDTDVVRLIRFFDFNEPVEIEAPPA